MNSLKFIMIASIVLSSLACTAQIKNQQTEIVKIYGNCGMCESTIEKAGNINSQASVDWNKETKMATLSYNSLKTSKEEILKRIALAGYDSDTFLAPENTYASLPSCCQYERAKTTNAKIDEATMDRSKNNHSMHSNKITQTQESNLLSVVFDTYFAVKDALVSTDGTKASAEAKNLLLAINNVKMDQLSMDIHMVWMKALQNLKEGAEHISETKEISLQRDHFTTLSKNMYTIIKVSKQEKPIYYQFCPMANSGKGANWLSKEETIKNPYYGSQMLSCGKTVETIKE